MARRNLGKTMTSLKVMIYGKEGTQKSNLAIQMATMKKQDGTPLKVLLLDLEYKALEGFNEAWLEKENVDFGNVCEIRTRDLDLISILCTKFVNGQPIPYLNENDEIVSGKFEKDADGNDFIADVIIFDSISVLNDLFIEGRQSLVNKRTNIKIAKEGLFGDEKELALENAGMQFLDYAKLKTKALKLVRDLQACTGKHVAYISRAKDAKETKIVNGKMESIDLGYEVMDSTVFKFLPYEVSLIIHNQNKNGITTFTLEKEGCGVHEKGKIYTEFTLKDYEDYINNKNRTELLKVKTYAENVDKASMFTEDSEDDQDAKFKIWNEIITACKSDNVKGAIIKKYCSENNVKGLNNPEMVSMSDLVEMKKILDKNK